VRISARTGQTHKLMATFLSATLSPGSIDRLVEMSSSLAASVEQQAAVTADIARNVNE
jgi:hypothetical protein